MAKHPQPGIQKGISQSFRAQQQSVGEGVSKAVARLWNAGFSIKEARDSWETMRPALVMLVNRYYAASQNAGHVYYDACRITAGLGPLPLTVKVKQPILDAHHLGRVIDPCGLGAFLHEVKGGAMMMDAYTSARKTLQQAVATLILSGARDYVQAASDADPASRGVRRVTSGTCGYCENLAAMGAKVPAGGWHADCDCTNEPTFGTDTGPSPSLPASDTGSIGIQEASWNKTVEYVGNSLKSGNLKDAQEYLNPDGSLNESKAITKLLDQHKNDEPYSLSASGKPLNNTQTKLLDKFFSKLTGTKKNTPLPNKKTDPVKEAQKNLDDAVQALMNNPMDQPDNIAPLQDKLAEADKALADAKKKAKPKSAVQEMIDKHNSASKKAMDEANAKGKPAPPDENLFADHKMAEAKEKLKAAEKNLIAKENAKTNMPFAQNGGKDYDKAVQEWEQAKNEHFQAVQHLQFLTEQAEKAKPTPSPKSKGPLSAAEKKKLDEAITNWKTGNSIARQKIQNDVIKALTGNGSNVDAKAKAIARAFQEESEDAPQLFRGLSWNINDSFDKPQWEAMKAVLDKGVGGQFDLPPSSFSEGEEWPSKFMEMKQGDNTRKMKIILQGGSRGLNIEDLGPKQNELEWLTGGRFEVVSMGKHGNSFNLVIKQVAGLDSPTLQMKKPETGPFVSAITSWKGSSVTLSKAVMAILADKPSTNVQAQTIVDFLRTNTEAAPQLWRGLKFYNYGVANEDEKAFDAANQVGKIVDVPAASFSQKRSVGVNFAGGSTTTGITKYMYVLKGGKGMNIWKTGGTMLHEEEWITGGRFKVLGRAKNAQGITEIEVEQVATLVE